jgi:hypothetical protein
LPAAVNIHLEREDYSLPGSSKLRTKHFNNLQHYVHILFCDITVIINVNSNVTVFHFGKQSRDELLTVNFVISKVEINAVVVVVLYWCFCGHIFVNTRDGTLSIGSHSRSNY